MTLAEARKISADFRTVHAYYARLADQAERAIRGEVPAPVVPPLRELQVVDGWIVWNGHPVWTPREKALTNAQPVRSCWTPAQAEAAYIEAMEQGLEATHVHLQRARERVSSGTGSPESRALRLAKVAYLESLLEQQRRALRGEVAPPAVPAVGEKLELVDGWLMWKGRPVWWSGQRPEGRPAANPPASTAPAAQPAPRRPKFRHLIRRLRPRPA